MAFSPLDLQKVTFKKKLNGFDPTEVENLLSAVGDELAGHLAEIEKLERENRYYRQRLQDSQGRESQLQETLLQVQRVSDQIRNNAQQEGELVVKEAQHQAHKIVHRAIEEAAKVEAKVVELKMARRELYHKFKQTVDFFERLLEAESPENDRGELRTMPSRLSEDVGEVG
jgi:cell division initiation protein